MANDTCSVDGCFEPVTIKMRGLCNRHYCYSRAHGFLVTHFIATSLPEHLWQRVEKRPNGCWHWIGNILATGYGGFGSPSQLAHRLVYELLVEPIAAGLQVDHQCHNRDFLCAGGDTCLHRRCVNPSHLEAVTPLINLQRGLSDRKVACVHGHAYDAANTYFTKAGHRKCRTCARLAARRTYGWKGGR